VSLTAERRQSIIEGINFEHGVQPSNFSRHRRPSILEGGILDTQEGVPAEAREAQNARALQVLARVKEKLTGRDFKHQRREHLPALDRMVQFLVSGLDAVCFVWSFLVDLMRYDELSFFHAGDSYFDLLLLVTRVTPLLS
jgi:FKBP12-rapamycin complex-associated protein